MYFLLPVGNINFPIQHDFLNATYDEYVLLLDPGSCSMLRASYGNHEAVSQELL